ncbi:glycosyltransferase [Bacillus pseudomycoides]|uniref:glycosyltransferase n=1 Tax=Bacillus pseudomycoides TaxID=64104 RepID=UPI0023DCBC6B|nr:glycosyltransferase [Bacillus pseudomycoides]MDF2082845.1 glycosyltransferase [Bacillus pseudomycoides]
MKIYFKTYPYWGRSIHRVEKYIKQYAPADVYWIDDWKQADLIIEQLVGPDDVLTEKLKSGIPYSLLLHSSLGGSGNEFYYNLLKNAEWVYSWVPLKEIGFDGNLILGPFGVDVNTFKSMPGLHKRYNVLTTGYVANSEGIDSMVEANKRYNGSLVHVGGSMNNDFGKPVESLPGVIRYENISEEELRTLYNMSKYVSGLRRFEGFELPVIEGLMCGSRPICFDTPNYRRWFNDFAVFIPELDDTYQLAEKLLEVFKSNYRPVTLEEQIRVKDFFNWERIAKLFWMNLKS